MKNLLILICVLSMAPIANAQWTWQNPTPQGNPLNTVHFPSPDIGYAAGEFGTIIKTIDGGQSWSIMYNIPWQTFNSIYFTDENTGFVVGNNSMILKTSDGAQHGLQYQVVLF